MRKILATAALVFLVSGCATDGEVSAEGKLAIETTVRIAVRHALDSPRAAEKIENIRDVAAELQQALRTDVTVEALAAAVGAEIDKLGLDPISAADAHDLVRLFAALIEQRVGSGDLKPDGLIAVADFVDLVLSVLPEG